MMQSLNIRIRLVLWHLVLFTLLLVMLGSFSYLLLLRGVDEKTSFPASVKLAQTERTPNGVFRVTDIQYVNPQNWGSGDNVLAGVSNFSGDQLSKSEIVTIKTPRGDIQFDTALIDMPDLSSNHQIWVSVYASPDNPDAWQLLVITQETSGATSSLALFRSVLLVAFPVAMVVAGVISLFLVTKGLRPIQSITKAARDIQENNLNKRIRVTTADEIGELATTLNNTFERLEDAFRREKQFTADASHELRAPLSTIQGESTLALSKERKPDEYKKALEIISREAQRIAAILKRLMFLARDDSEMKLEFEGVDLGNFISELVLDCETSLVNKQLKLRITAESHLSTVVGDKIILREMFYNLLDNAINYTPDGGNIEITIGREDGYARVSIQDSGMGIPDEDIPLLFERFYRVDKSRSRNDGGVGLGLSICKRIAEIHRGRINVTSKIGEGSIFTTLLPLIPHKVKDIK